MKPLCNFQTLSQCVKPRSACWPVAHPSHPGLKDKWISPPRPTIIPSAMHRASMPFSLRDPMLLQQTAFGHLSFCYRFFYLLDFSPSSKARFDSYSPLFTFNTHSDTFLHPPESSRICFESLPGVYFSKVTTLAPSPLPPPALTPFIFLPFRLLPLLCNDFFHLCFIFFPIPFL